MNSGSSFELDGTLCMAGVRTHYLLSHLAKSRRSGWPPTGSILLHCSDKRKGLLKRHRGINFFFLSAIISSERYKDSRKRASLTLTPSGTVCALANYSVVKDLLVTRELSSVCRFVRTPYLISDRGMSPPEASCPALPTFLRCKTIRVARMECAARWGLGVALCLSDHAFDLAHKNLLCEEEGVSLL